MTKGDVCEKCGTIEPERCKKGHCLKCAGQCHICEGCLICEGSPNNFMCTRCADDESDD